MIPIKKYGSLFDFQKSAYFTNICAGNYIAPKDTVLTWSFKHYQGETITVYEARRVEYINGTLQVIETIDLFGTLTITESLSTSGYSYYYQNANDLLPSNLDKGRYYLYLSDGTNEWQSEIFASLGFVSYDKLQINSVLLADVTVFETVSTRVQLERLVSSTQQVPGTITLRYFNSGTELFIRTINFIYPAITEPCYFYDTFEWTNDAIGLDWTVEATFEGTTVSDTFAVLFDSLLVDYNGFYITNNSNYILCQ